MSKLYFFRHAQASYGAADYDQLSRKGEQQSLALGKYLLEKDMRFDKIYVGPLKRQRRTFEIVESLFSKEKRYLPEPLMLPELKEHSGPEATLIAIPDMVKTVPMVQKWHAEMIENPTLKRRNSLLVFQYFMQEWALGNIQVEGVEPWADFRKEVRKGLDHILANTGNGETIAAFTSGGTISSITAEALGLQNEKRVTAMNFSVRNTSFSTFLFSKDQFNLLSFNELPHLGEEMVTFV